MTASNPIISSSSADLESADRALKQRPRISIRLRVALGFMLTFLIICALIISAIVFLSRLGTKERFIEKAGNYLFEIQQARRFEKDYLLYGTDFEEALSFVNNARHILEAYGGDFCAVIGQDAYVRMSKNLLHYRGLLARLGELKTRTHAPAAEQGEMMQADLRRSGAELVSDAANAIDKERLLFHTWLHTSKIIAASVLVFILILEIYMVAFIARHIFLPFKRFENYMQRIADGDFSPITPVKKHQDEFTDLAVAVNRMLKEIQDRGAQLVESGKMVAFGTLSAGIAHEINNPLNNISLTTETLIYSYHDLPDPEKLEFLHEIFSQVERASATVANLLDFTHRDQSAFKPIDVREVIDAAAALLQNELRLGNVRLKMVSDGLLPHVRGHHQNLRNVLINLFLNAVEAMPGGGRLTVSTSVEDGFVRIDVVDTGPGIPEEIQAQIFDPFFTTKAVGKGTGLGLSVSFGIISKHNGSISFTSEVGHGSTFTVRLPVG